MGGIPDDVDANLVKFHFSRWGNVVDIYFPGKSSLKRVNYCFVTFDNWQAAQRSCNQSERSIAGRVSCLDPLTLYVSCPELCVFVGVGLGEERGDIDTRQCCLVTSQEGLIIERSKVHCNLLVFGNRFVRDSQVAYSIDHLRCIERQL